MVATARLSNVAVYDTYFLALPAHPAGGEGEGTGDKHVGTTPHIQRPQSSQG